MKCSRCDASGVVSIGLKAGGRDITMRSCSRCGFRTWEGEGQGMPLARVLDLAGRR